MKFCKYDTGLFIRSVDSGKRSKVVVQSFLPLANVKDFIIGSSLILAGVSYISYKAFCNGAYCFKAAQNGVLRDIGCIHD